MVPTSPTCHSHAQLTSTILHEPKTIRLCTTAWRIQLRPNASNPAWYTSDYPLKSLYERHVVIPWSKGMVSWSLNEPFSVSSRLFHQNKKRTRLRLCWIFPTSYSTPLQFFLRNFIIPACDLAYSLKNPAPQAPFSNIGDSQIVVIEKLSNIFLTRPIMWRAQQTLHNGNQWKNPLLYLRECILGWLNLFLQYSPMSLNMKMVRNLQIIWPSSTFPPSGPSIIPPELPIQSPSMNTTQPPRVEKLVQKPGQWSPFSQRRYTWPRQSIRFCANHKQHLTCRVQDHTQYCGFSSWGQICHHICQRPNSCTYPHHPLWNGMDTRTDDHPSGKFHCIRHRN